MITSLIPSFNAGELSPLIHLRADLEKYRSGCRTLENMTITPYGGVKRRAGLSYTATAETRCRLFSFQASISEGYILEFGDVYLRFFRHDSRMLDDAGALVTLATPYGLDDLDGIQIAQINDVAYITHPVHPVQKLVRLRSNLWELNPVDFSYPPMLDENLDRAKELETLAAAAPGVSVGLRSNFPFFAPDMVGGFVELSHERKEDQFEVSIAATSGNDGDFTSALMVQGAWNFTTSGTWDGTFLVQRDSGDGWETIRRFTSNSDANYTAGGEEKTLVKMRVGWQHGGSGSSSPRGRLESSELYIRGVVRVTAVESDGKATGEAVTSVMAGVTSHWREGAWSDRKGYPRCVAAHEQRLIFGGTESRPQTLWASAVDDYEDFQPGGSNDSDSWTHTLVSGQQNAIQWIVSQKSLLVGTSGDEWSLAANKDEAIITPTSVRARRQSGNGSAFIRARPVNDSVFFVQRGGRVARNLLYSYEADGFVTDDLTLLAEHITGEGIIDIALQMQPEQVLWCVTKDGRLLGLTFDHSQKITGWHRHITGSPGDGFESVAVRRVDGEADQVWVSVRRWINGAWARYIERLKPDGFFLEEPWSLLLADPEGRPIWNMLWRTWTAGTWAFPSSESGDDDFADAENLYQCVETYDAAVQDTVFGNSPASEPDRWTAPYVKWGVNANDVGDKVFHYPTSLLYECIQFNTAHSVEPGVDLDWEDYWILIGSYPPPVPYYAQTYYDTGDEVQEDFKAYVGIDGPSVTQPHKPKNDFRPTNPTYGPLYWQVIQGEYHEGDHVSRGGVNYVCLADHTPTSASEPGVGGSWGSYWSPLDTNNLIFFVDSGVTLINPGEITEMAGLDHLEGETVQVVANGAVLKPRAVSAGKITFDMPGDPTSFTNVCAGLAFVSILQPMALEVGMQNGTSTSREKRIHELVVYFHNSYGCMAGPKLTGDFDRMKFYDTADGDSPTLFSGPVLHKLDARHDLDASFVLKQDLPMPMHVLAVVPKFNVYGDNI